MPPRPRPPRAGTGVLALGAALAMLPPAAAVTRTRLSAPPAGAITAPAPLDSLSSAEWLSLLPDGEEKRRFITDCTGCHVFDARITRPNGTARTEQGWRDAIGRMLGFAGATTGFPVISSDRDAARTAAWLARHVGDSLTFPAARDTPVFARAEVTEFPMPMPNDLPHDLQVDADGNVVITGMFSHAMWLLDPASGRMSQVPIPVEQANPRAVEIGPRGEWWIVLGARHQLARFDPATLQWRTFDVGMYAHSVALAPDGRAWVNGHFTKAPELLKHVDAATAATQEVALPPHPSLAGDAAGPIPYEIRAAPDGRLWMTELQGNRLVMHDPTTGISEAFDLPVPFAAPRRHDVDRAGTIWVPAYAANALLAFDPASRSWRQHALPVRDAVPYVARVHPATGRIWVGTAAADAMLEFDPANRAWRVYALPSRGAMVRHMAFDARNGDVWVAYGASPGIAARVARVRAR